LKLSEPCCAKFVPKLPKGQERIEATDTDGTLLTVYNYE
jgi:hypothetical protein